MPKRPDEASIYVESNSNFRCWLGGTSIVLAHRAFQRDPGVHPYCFCKFTQARYARHREAACRYNAICAKSLGARKSPNISSM